MLTEQWRLFIAIELPEAVLDDLARLQTKLKDAVNYRSIRWVKPTGMHLTLRFLGDTPIKQIEEATEVFASAIQAHHSLTLSTGGLGCFPNTKRPSVLFTQVEAPQTLFDLQNSIERAAATFGYKSETRPYTPHITLARVDRRATRKEQTEVGALAEAQTVNSVEWQVNQIAHIRSELQPSGSVYTTVHHFELKEG